MTKRIDTASRQINALPSRIYAAFSTAHALETWLPPQGMTGKVTGFDFREGSHYRMRLTYSQTGHTPGKTSEHSDEVEVRFVKLVPNERIEQAVRFNTEKSEFAGEMRITWILAEAKEGTHVTVACENVPEGIRPEDHREGLTASLQNLAAFVERNN